jgi:glucokinase
MTVLLCDVGGTHIRFAVGSDGQMTCAPEKLRVDSHVSLEDAVGKYLLSQSIKAQDVTALYLAFSNRNNWKTEESMLRAVLPNAALRQINDFEANALGLLTTDTSDLTPLISAAGGIARAARAVIGVGTGLGLAYIEGQGAEAFVRRTHGGHMLPATALREHRDIFDHIAASKKDGTIPIFEDVLSGSGLFALYRFVCHASHLNPEYHDTADLLLSGKDDPVMRQTLRLFHEILGVFAHEVAAFGYAYNGLYITGGIIDRLMAGGLFDTQAFTAHFHQKNVPIVVEHVKATPVYWVRDEFVSLRGLLRQSQLEKQNA